MNTRALIGLGLLLAFAVTLAIILRKRIAGMATWTWPAQGRISSPFGQRTAPIAGASTMHNGIDIALPIGTEVKAPADGTVKSVFNGGSGGKSIILEHANGWLTGYAHLSSQLVTEGQEVKQGDVIALSGNTGNSGGPHLHFTMTDPAGDKVDPMKYLA